MHFETADSVQSAVVQGTVYVGGGYTHYDSEDYTIKGYDTCSGKWAKLPPYRVKWFTMTVIHNQLVLVGGYDKHDCSKVVGVWRADTKQWTHPYPEMPTARAWCSAAVYNEWLVVTGGIGSGGRL